MTERKREDFFLVGGGGSFLHEGVGTEFRGKNVRAFLATTLSRSSASKLEAMLKEKKVLFHPTGRRSY